MRIQTVLILAVLGLASVPVFAKQSVSEIRLWPGMPSVEHPVVAPIYPTPPDADVLKSAVGIEPSQPYRWIVSPGKAFEAKVSGSDASVDHCVLTVWDWEFRPLAQMTLDVPFSRTVDFNVKGRGTYLLTLDGMKDGKCLFRLPRSFAVCPSNVGKRHIWKQNDFWLGQVSVPGRQWFDAGGGHRAHPDDMSEDESRDLDAELVARLGVGFSRIDMPVLRKDAAGMVLDFSKSDPCVNAFASRGLKLDLQLGVAYGDGMGPILPRYETPYPWIYPVTDPAYRHYVSETFKRYRKQTAFVQVNNEPDNWGMFRGSPSEFIEMVRSAGEEVKRIDPSMPVTNGGYCLADPEKTRTIVPGVKGLTDFVSYHCHDDLATLKTKFAEIQGIHRKAGYVNPRYAITEVGLWMQSIAVEHLGAFTEMQKVIYCWAHGNVGAMLYSSRELGWPRQHKTEYGFVDYFFCPRFTYGAVAAFIDHYAGVRFDRIVHESNNLHVYLFRGKGRLLASVFAAKQPVDVTLTSDARKISVIDPMGNTRDAENGPSIHLTAGSYPQTIVFQGGTKVELADSAGGAGSGR